MSCDWSEIQLGDFLELKRGYDLPNKNRKEGAFEIISSSGPSGFHSERKVKGPGVVTGRYGTIGKVFYSERDFWPLNTTLYVKDFKGNHPEFVYYFLKTLDFLQYSDKAAVPGVNRNHLHTAWVKVPESIAAQEKIAKALSVLDKKIALNAQINQTLEQMAQALFKSWFVDFDPVIDNALEAGHPIPEPLAERVARRQAMWAAENKAAPTRLPAETRRLFPDRFEEDEALGWVPAGWKSKPLSQQVSLIGGGTPKRSEKSFWGGDIPWFSVKDAPSEPDVFVLDTEDKITNAGLEGSSARLLPAGTTIISARGTVGKLAITGMKMAMNQSCYGAWPAEGLGNYYNFYNIKNAVVELQQNVHGAVFDTITRQTFETVSSPFPSENVAAEFEARVSLLMEKIKAALEENVTLTQLRNTLLPRLLSGELQLPEAEAAIESVLETETA